MNKGSWGRWWRARDANSTNEARLVLLVLLTEPVVGGLAFVAAWTERLDLLASTEDTEAALGAEEVR
jgi:hypothetical protein